jgi:membrane protein implicated in regulation of membrane protease activity
MIQKSAGNPGVLARIGAGIAVALAVVAGLALSAFFFGFFLVVAGLFAAWLGWQRWRLRKHLRKNHQGKAQGQAVIIQGEYEVVEDATPPHATQSQRSTSTNRSSSR